MSPPPLQTLQLPDDIVEEILLRLPASSLVPLKLVCRSWRTLISSSKFSDEHLRRSILVDPTLSHHPQIAYCIQSYTQRRIGVFSVRSVLENNRVEPTEVASMIVGQRRSRIIGSCNGLLCLIHKSHSLTSAILWNPCTGFTSEPTPAITGSFLNVGFGYDDISKRYKLFMMVTARNNGQNSRIYTFAPNSSWETFQDFDFNLVDHPPYNCYYPIEHNNAVGVFVSGSKSKSNTLNWALQLDDGFGNGGFHMVISLDLGRESFGILSLPTRDPDDNHGTNVELSCFLF